MAFILTVPFLIYTARMNFWHHKIIIKPLSYLLLCMMGINPAYCLQYTAAPLDIPITAKPHGPEIKVFYLQEDQLHAAIEQLGRKGYTIVPGSREQLDTMRLSHVPANTMTQQLAALGSPSQEQAEPPPPDEATATSNCRNRTPPRPEPTVHGNINVGINSSSGGGGGSGDGAQVLFIVIGMVVIAALIVYAAKYIVDVLNDYEQYDYWWDIATQFTSLDGDAGEHANFSALKIASGFVVNDRVRLGLAGELGNMDMDLILNKRTTPKRLALSGTYWLLGAAVHFNLFTQSIRCPEDAHYMFLEFLGGTSEHTETDVLGAARLGFNFAITKHLRWGIHYGAMYIGLNEDEGFANDGDNYFNTYGFEFGYRF